MKHAILSIITLVLSIASISCKKDNTVSSIPSPSLAGTWKGQYDYNGYPDRYYYSFELNANGSLKEVNAYGVIVGEGIWKLSGSSFTATYKSLGSAGKTYSVTATYDANGKKLTGTWGKGNKVDEGQWFMYRQ